MKKLLIAGIALTALLAAPAMAADLPAKAPVYKAPPPVVVPYSWTGFYAGLNAGYGWGNMSTTEIAVSPSFFLGIGDTWSQRNRGFIGGGQIGYNWQLNSFVYGIEAEFGGTSLKGSGQELLDTLGATTAEFKARWYGDVRARAGIAFDRSLFYVTGGWAWLNADVGTQRSPVAPTVNTITNKTLSGAAFGGGWEYAFAGNWSAKAEYLGIKLNSVDTTGFTSIPTFRGWNHSFGVVNIVRLGLNYRFGGGPVYAKY